MQLFLFFYVNYYFRSTTVKKYLKAYRRPEALRWHRWSPIHSQQCTDTCLNPQTWGWRTSAPLCRTGDQKKCSRTHRITWHKTYWTTRSSHMGFPQQIKQRINRIAILQPAYPWLGLPHGNTSESELTTNIFLCVIDVLSPLWSTWGNNII